MIREDYNWAFRIIEKHCLQIHCDYAQYSRRWLVTPTFRTHWVHDGSPISDVIPSAEDESLIEAVKLAIARYGLDETERMLL
jgi:hypothetical protein